MKITKGNRKEGTHGLVFFECDKCSHKHKLDADEVYGTIMVLEDLFDNL